MAGQDWIGRWGRSGWYGILLGGILSLGPAAMVVFPKPTEPWTESTPRSSTYQERVEDLQRSAAIAAQQQWPRLSILLGDSLSLVFPPELLPRDRSWLNQSISGESSGGLVRRLSLLDDTRPTTIFLMIGINDLLKGEPPADLLQRHRQILRYLRQAHPHSQIVVQSLLPHRGPERATWEGRDRLAKIPNGQIRAINQQLRAIALGEQAYYLDLHPLFTDGEGNLQASLSSDGLHLSHQGYWVWRTALQSFSQWVLEAPPLGRSLPEAPPR